MRSLFIGLLATVALAGAAAPASAAETRATSDAGHKIYVSKCAKCHKFYNPAKYSDSEWNSWMNKMSKKAKLTTEQQKELTSYIQQALRSGKGDRADARKP